MPKHTVVKQGDRYGRLTIRREIEPRLHYRESDGCTRRIRRVRCLCDCGGLLDVNLNALRSGNTQSCGCLNSEAVQAHATRHGLHKHPLYYIWAAMRERCSNPEVSNYHRYGGRGIRVCKEWEVSFETFYNYCISLPEDKCWRKGYDIDRKNNDGDYEPGNCFFVSRIDNSRNTSVTIWCLAPKELTKKEIESRREWMRVNKKGELEIIFKDLWELRGHSKTCYETAKSRYNVRGWDALKSVSLPPLFKGPRSAKRHGK
jgi:hypothetical protein